MLEPRETPPHQPGRVVPSILVVDDHADARDMMSGFLSSCGFVVHTASDGLDAIAVAQRVLPSIILMDLMMPRMDGFEATRRLKTDTRTSAIPVIAFTASALTDGGQLARAAGFDALFAKPCDLDMLADDLRTRLDLPTSQQPDGSTDARSVNIDLSLEEAIAADIALDDAIAAAIEGRDRRTDRRK